jgi:hypothetical protein
MAGNCGMALGVAPSMERVRVTVSPSRMLSRSSDVVNLAALPVQAHRITTAKEASRRNKSLRGRELKFVCCLGRSIKTNQSSAASFSGRYMDKSSADLFTTKPEGS